MATFKLKAACENPAFEWFFLLVDAGIEQGIWATNGFDLEFVPAASTATQLKERNESGIKIGFVNAAEVTLARLNGVQVKTVAAYFGETTARIFVAATGPINQVKDLDGRKIGIISNTHTSYRTVLYMNEKLAQNSEPVQLGSLANNLVALNSGQIDAFYSAEGSPLTLVESGELRVILSLSDIYPRPYTAVVVWAADDLIEQSPSIVRGFVKATLETV